MELSVSAGKIDSLGKFVAVVKIAIQNILNKKSHTMLLLDCSGSMSGAIGDVRNDSQTYIDGLNDDDFVSVIIFSGHGRSRLISGPTQCNLAGKELLKQAIRNDVRILDTTVFSEPLNLTITTVKSLAGVDVVHNAVLFTDGCAVPTMWNVSTEHDKSFEAARILHEMGVIVSVVGYGVYYDTSFINRLMEVAGGEGLFRHISEIEDFGSVIEQIRDVFAKTVMADINIAFLPLSGKIKKVFKTTPQLSVVSESGDPLKMSELYEGKATFFVEMDRPCSVMLVSGSVNGVGFGETLSAETLTDEDAADYIRVLGAHAFLIGDRALAAQLLSLTVDEALAEQTASAYTERERRETGDNLRRYFVDRKFIGAGLKATGPNHSVLNVLRALIEDQENVVYIPNGAYKRSGELTRDPNIVEQPLGRVLKVLNYRSHENRFNFSLLCLKDVKVIPEGGGAPEDKKIWRTYNVILDGNLHLPELLASLSEKSFDLLKEAGVIESSEAYIAGKTYTVNLRSLKMISPNWANPGTLGLVPLLKEEKELEEEQKALNARLKELSHLKPDVSGGDIYFGKASKVDGLPVEYYSADCCEYRLLGYKAQTYDCSQMEYEAAASRVADVRQRLIVVRFLVRSIVFAMESVGSKSIRWDEGKITTRGEYPKLEQTATYLDAELKRVTWNEQFVCS